MRTRIVGAALALACAGMGLAGCTADDTKDDEAGPSVIAPGKPGEENRTLSPEEARSSAPNQKPNDADYSYMQDMILHHAQAIEMTDLAEKKAVAKQVKGIASRIADSQGPEIDAMNRWLKQHGREPVDISGKNGGGHGEHGEMDHGAMPGMASAEQMEELASARGAKFDQLFLKLMITHHQGALTMARELQTKGMDVRVQEMADEVIATQSAEIGKMREMLQGN